VIINRGLFIANVTQVHAVFHPNSCSGSIAWWTVWLSSLFTEHHYVGFIC